MDANESLNNSPLVGEHEEKAHSPVIRSSLWTITHLHVHPPPLRCHVHLSSRTRKQTQSAIHSTHHNLPSSALVDVLTFLPGPSSAP
ncbi:hypothetical protein ATANTOWER_030739 [Ataeniobius toweri]|uniref:Uncharacterized protein n=1 Tax=Ataeniobius toweri TaxID=208326 RepID=A0ABU7A3A7_9TELE|nr:hypothetical protein [Ataeniobius toweri]